MTGSDLEKKGLDEKFFNKIAGAVFNFVGFDMPKDGEFQVELAFVGEGEMKKLNRRWRGKNKVTDVLSFSDINMPLGKIAVDSGLQKIAKSKLTQKHIEPKSEILKEDVYQIIVCLPYAKKKARRENLTQNQELAMLFSHGILHILGYDHERSEEEEKVMNKMQEIMTEKFK